MAKQDVYTRKALRAELNAAKAEFAAAEAAHIGAREPNQKKKALKDMQDASAVIRSVNAQLK